MKVQSPFFSPIFTLFCDCLTLAISFIDGAKNSIQVCLIRKIVFGISFLTNQENGKNFQPVKL